MAIEDIQWASNDQVTLTKQDGMVKDITNDVDNIHKQYLMGTSIVSGSRVLINETGVSQGASFKIPFFHHTDFTTNYRAMFRYLATENNTLSLIIQNAAETVTEATPISSVSYTASAVALFTADFTFSKATANYILFLQVQTSVTDGNIAQVAGNIVALPKF